MVTAGVLTGPWRRTFDSVVRSARARLTLCAPYVSEAGANAVLSARTSKDAADLGVVILTNLSPSAICAGATDPAAIAALVERFPRARAVHLPRLHAKVYAADGRRAIVTSGNLTRGGLEANYECGVLLEDEAVVCAVEQEVAAYAELGGVVDRSTLAEVCALAADARAAYRTQLKSASKLSTRRLATVMRQADDVLVRAKLAGGPIHTVLGRTIEFLLRRYGPLSTVELHPLVQQLHPDLCDDSIDRVIDGQRFGRKWKHAVRSAQQHLKKRGIIARHGKLWGLVE